MTARLLLLALLPLAACSAPADPPTAAEPPASVSPPASVTTPASAADTPEDRARAAGLIAAQAAQIASLRAPVALPSRMDGWRVDRVQIDDPAMDGTPMGVVGYAVRWSRLDGACVEILASNDGLGGPDFPTVSTRIRLMQMPGTPEAELFKAADDPEATSAQNWGQGTVISDYVASGDEADFLAIWLLSTGDDGCQPLELEEAAGILARLRPLRDGGSLARDPLDDPTLGRFAFDDGVTGDAVRVGNPEQTVRAYFEGAETPTEVETVRETADEVRVLATQSSLADDSVRDLRTLFVFEASEDGWTFVVAGTQTRCWPERGHQDWSAERCL